MHACEDAWSRGHAKSRVYGETERRDPTYSYRPPLCADTCWPVREGRDRPQPRTHPDRIAGAASGSAAGGGRFRPFRRRGGAPVRAVAGAHRTSTWAHGS